MAMQNMKRLAAAFAVSAAVVTAAAPPAHAQSLDSTLASQAMFGINKENGKFFRYDFSSASLKEVGTLQAKSGAAMLGVRAAGYFPGHQQAFVLWQAPDNKNKLVYVDVTTAKAVVVAEDVEGGLFTGACTVQNVATPFGFFAMQNAKVKPPSSIAGLININPNNSPQNEFTLKNGDSFTLTRDDLHDKMAVQADGSIYKGKATFVHVKPKGNGGQTGLMINGTQYDLRNSNTYDFNGEMDVRVYNDKPTGGKAMGKWWIQIYSGQVYINETVQVLTPHRIAQVDQKTGTVTELMTVTRPYRGLATLDGLTFFTSFGQDLYKIDTVLGTEMRIGDTTLTRISDVEFVGNYLLSYNNANTSLRPLNPVDAQPTASALNLGMGELGPIMFTPLAKDPTLLEKTYD